MKLLTKNKNLTKKGAKNTSTYNQETKTVVTDYSNQDYNQQVLGLEYDDEGNIKNPFEKPAVAAPATESVGSLDCDGAAPDQYGCCPGETYTDMGDQGFNCCPDGGGDCFPPLDLN